MMLFQSCSCRSGPGATSFYSAKIPWRQQWRAMLDCSTKREYQPGGALDLRDLTLSASEPIADVPMPCPSCVLGLGKLLRAQMERDQELAIIRRAFAKQILAAAQVDSAHLEQAFARVRREDFLGPGPWVIPRWAGE